MNPTSFNLPSTEETKLQLEKEELRKAAAELERRRVEARAAHKRGEQEARSRLEEDAEFQREAETLRRTALELARKLATAATRVKIEEQARKRALEESQTQLTEDEIRKRTEAEARKNEEARRPVEPEAQHTAAETRPAAGQTPRFTEHDRLRGSQAEGLLREAEELRRIGGERLDLHARLLAEAQERIRAEEEAVNKHVEEQNEKLI
jgi:hypothetical protein